MRWFKKLKKWQRGGLIGCAVGIIFAVIILLSPHQDSLGEWISNVHSIFFILIWVCLGLRESNHISSIIEYGGLAAIVIFCGGLGALFGKFQQMAKPVWKWLLTALLALFLLSFYVINIIGSGY